MFLDNVFYVFINKKTKCFFGFLWVCVKNFLEIFLESIREPKSFPLRLLAGWRKRRMDLFSVLNLMSERAFNTCIGYNLKEYEVT